MSVVRLIVATRSSNILISGKIIKEMPVSVASGTLCIIQFNFRLYGYNVTYPNHIKLLLLHKYRLHKLRGVQEND